MRARPTRRIVIRVVALACRCDPFRSIVRKFPLVVSVILLGSKLFLGLTSIMVLLLPWSILCSRGPLFLQ